MLIFRPTKNSLIYSYSLGLGRGEEAWLAQHSDPCGAVRVQAGQDPNAPGIESTCSTCLDPAAVTIGSLAQPPLSTALCCLEVWHL